MPYGDKLWRQEIWQSLMDLLDLTGQIYRADSVIILTLLMNFRDIVASLAC